MYNIIWALYPYNIKPYQWHHQYSPKGIAINDQ